MVSESDFEELRNEVSLLKSELISMHSLLMSVVENKVEVNSGIILSNSKMVAAYTKHLSESKLFKSKN